MPSVYSYLRFSDPKQAAGSSAERQAQYAERWAAERGMVLDQSLSLRDEGLSAYHQHHVKQGALGTFLRAVEDGLIPAGSVLVVEGLDRLSRAEPLLAQAQLAQIINAGISVVTASDGREYNRASLKAQPMDLVYSLLVMIRAHEESDTKSKRVKAAIRRQCQNWLAGTYRGYIRNGKDPAWLREAGGGFEIIPERADTIRAAISLYSRGYGAVRVIRELTERGMALSTRGNAANYIHRLPYLRALVGEKVIELDGEEYRLPGYYPALLTEAEFDALQGAAGARTRRKGRGEIPSLITGLGICKCGYCGQAIVGQNLMNRKRLPDGRPQVGHRRIMCCSHTTNKGCPVGGSCSVVPLENAIMEFCADQLNLAAMLAAGSDMPIRERLAKARARVSELERQIDRITMAMLDSEDVPAAFARKARELEAELKTERANIESCERELAGMKPVPVDSGAWASLRAGVESLDYSARMEARRLVAETFSSIVIYHRGALGDERCADILLTSKRGGIRALRVNKRTGELVIGEKFVSAA